jgi:hypothetical protein
MKANETVDLNRNLSLQISLADAGRQAAGFSHFSQRDLLGFFTAPKQMREPNCRLQQCPNSEAFPNSRCPTNGA